MSLIKPPHIRGGWLMLPLFTLSFFLVSCEKTDHDESCPEGKSITTEACDSTDTLKTNIGAEGWGETVNVKF